MKKIKVQYPDGHIECMDNVSDTYRNAIRFIGLDRVRSEGIFRNSINIVSTTSEVLNSSGKMESLHVEDGTDYVICTQFSTNDKYRHLIMLNQNIHKNMKIWLEEGGVIYSPEEHSISIDPIDDKILSEGLRKECNSQRYERNQVARKLCIEHYGKPVVCQICGFDFERFYGKRESHEIYIEVHHIIPISKVSGNGRHTVDYTKDLIPVCANCHRMLHHMRADRVLEPQELKSMIEQAQKMDHC